jgi:hypothetical protein
MVSREGGEQWRGESLRFRWDPKDAVVCTNLKRSEDRLRAAHPNGQC